MNITPPVHRLAALLCLLAASSAVAANACQPGASVTDRQGRTGIVADVGKNDCHVSFPDGSKRYYLGWMLRPAGTTPAEARGADRTTPGLYHCVAAGGVAGVLKLEIIDAGQYGNGAGKKGRYSTGGDGKLTFESGPWAGYFGKVLGPGKIGLASRDNGYYGTTCDRK